MKPWRIINADCREGLRELPDESVHCVVTSPPYWGLRDYGVEGQIGHEPSPDAFVEQLVAVFSEVRRVLRPDGTLWLNLGDSYARAGGPGWQGKNGQRADRRFTAVRDTIPMRAISRSAPEGLKSKDMVGIPWRVAFALQADGALNGRCWTCNGSDYYDTTPADSSLDWIIGGGESGFGARPCDVAWIRSIVEQCRAAGVACFVKQLGARPAGISRYTGMGRDWLRDRKGGDPSEWPEDLRVRQMPDAGR